jgi:hypothetical protein
LPPFIIESFPFYFEAKCIVLFYLRWNSAVKSHSIFFEFLKPTLDYFEPIIDDFLKRHEQDATRIKHGAIAAVTHVVNQNPNLFSSLATEAFKAAKEIETE